MKWKTVFRGPRGIRAGWRLLIFLATAVSMMAAFPWAANRIGYKPHPGWHPVDFLVSDGLGFIALLLAATVVARIEHGRVRDYGLPIRRGAGKLLGGGAVWGLATVAAVAALMAAFGGLSVSGLALHGRALASFALLWALVMVILGLFEEFFFRGYPQQALASGMGFWPAAVSISAAFGALHYFTKPRETVVDATSVALLGLFLCLTLRRTGDLWFAVGYHAAFDYAALIVLASPNTGMETGRDRAVGHLLDTSFHGPAWLTGGDCGLEASALIFPVLAALFLLFSRLYPRLLRRTSPVPY
ncbi:MAG TPA: CPBP family intramembrane glutamic endopeptidase [Thermoanaerobaculia bacterium]|nr:CPBP family intramembrane glutamic endopeptidase [Thermoanaerobaculia bacterium]